MRPSHPGLTPHDVLSDGGWHPRYARVLAIASDGDYGFALVDGNGDGAELEAETWFWDGAQWAGGSSSGAGPLAYLGREQTGGKIGNACFSYGSARGRDSVLIQFEGRRHVVPVGKEGTWAFIKQRQDPSSGDLPALIQ